MAETMFDYVAAKPNTPDMSGAIDATQEAQTWKSFQDVISGGAKLLTGVATDLENEQALKDTAEARMHAMRDAQSIEALSGTEKRMKIEGMVNTARNSRDNNSWSKSYAQTYVNSMLPVYGQALDAQTKEHDESTAYMAKTAWGEVLKAGVTDKMPVEEFVDWYSKSFNTTPKSVQTATVSALYEEGSTLYSNIFKDMDSKTPPSLATLQARLAEANNKFNEYESNYTGSKYYYGSKSPDMVEQIAVGKQQVTSAYKAAETQIKTIARGNIAGAEGNREDLYGSFTTRPNDPELQLSFDINNADNPLENKRAKETYTNEYNQTTEAKNFITQYPPDKSHPDYTNMNNAKLNKHYPKVVEDTLNKSIMSNNSSMFIDTIHFNPSSLGPTKNNIMSAFRGAKTTAELKPIMDFLDKTTYYPQGAGAIRQLIGDDEYVDISTTQIVADTLYEGSLSKARDYVAKVDFNSSSIMMDQVLFKKVQDSAVDMGPQYQKFLSVMSRMYQIDPAVATNKFDDVKDNFMSQVEHISTDTNWLGFGGTKIFIDKSIPDYVAGKALDEDFINTNIISKYTNDYNGVPSSVIQMGNTHTALVNDQWGGTAAFVDYSVGIDKANALYEKKKVETSRDYDENRGRWGKFIDGAGDIFIGSTVRITEGLGKVVSKFGNYLYNQTGKDRETLAKGRDEIYRILGLNPKTKEDKEAIEIALLMEQQRLEKTNDKVSSFKPNNNTMSSGNTELVRNVLLGNQAKAEKLKQFNDEIRMQSVLKHEGGYSKDTNDIGNYNTSEEASNKTNFVGTKFGISAPLLTQVLGRTATKADMQGLSETKAKNIMQQEFFEKYKVSKLPPQVQKIALHAYILSPANAEKALKMGGTSSADFSRNFLKQLKANVSNYNMYQYSWGKRFKELGVE